MAKFLLYVRTNKLGSKVEREIEIPDDELDELDDDNARFDFIEEYLSDEVWNLIDWGHERIG